jgi:hypothetical protein
MPVAQEKKQKPRNGHRPYAPRTCRAPKNGDNPQTSAISKPNTVREQLTLYDWLGVVQYFNSNQPISQEEVVKHFAGRSDGGLIFMLFKQIQSNKLLSTPFSVITSLLWMLIPYKYAVIPSST